MSYHSVEVMVYQYDKLFGCPNPNPHFYILVGYFWGTVILNWLPWQPAGKFRVPQKYKTVGYGWDTSHPTTISKKFIILIYHYLHAVESDSDSETKKVRFACPLKQVEHLSESCIASEVDNSSNGTRLARSGECLALEVHWNRDIPLVESS